MYSFLFEKLPREIYFHVWSRKIARKINLFPIFSRNMAQEKIFLLYSLEKFYEERKHFTLDFSSCSVDQIARNNFLAKFSSRKIAQKIFSHFSSRKIAQDFFFCLFASENCPKKFCICVFSRKIVQEFYFTFPLVKSPKIFLFSVSSPQKVAQETFFFACFSKKNCPRIFCLVFRKQIAPKKFLISFFLEK